MWTGHFKRQMDLNKGEEGSKSLPLQRGGCFLIKERDTQKKGLCGKNHARDRR